MHGVITSPPKQEKTGAALLPALGILAFSLLALGWLIYQPRDNAAPQLVFFSPFDGGEAALVSALGAGAKIIAKSPLPFALIVQSDDPAFDLRLKQAGAWLMLDASGRGLCGTLFTKNKEKST